MKSKQNDRNSITLFDASVKWNDFEKLNEIKKTIESWIDNKDINKSMLYRLNTFIRLAKEEKEILAIKESMDIEDWECLKWKALFKYSLIRNVGKDFKGDQKEKSIKFELQAHLENNTGNFSADSINYNLFFAVNEVLEKLRTQVGRG